MVSQPTLKGPDRLFDDVFSRRRNGFHNPAIDEKTHEPAHPVHLVESRSCRRLTPLAREANNDLLVDDRRGDAGLI